MTPFFLLICRECEPDDLVLPFTSAADRGSWAADHREATGHDRWFTQDALMPDG